MPAATRAWIASQLYSTVVTSFAHWENVPDLNFDRRFREYLDTAFATSDRRRFDLATIALLACLHSGHTGFGDSWLRRRYGQVLGFFAVWSGSQWVVEHSRVNGLAPGDIIERLNGESFEAFFQRQRRYVSASSERWARRALFESPFLFPDTLRLGLAGGRVVLVDRHAHATEEPDTLRTEGRVIGDDIGYVRIPGFYRAAFESTAVDFVRKFRTRRAIIIDVRENHGGSSPERLVSALMDRPWSWWSEATPVTVGLFQYYGAFAKAPGISDEDRGFYKAFREFFAQSQLSWRPTVNRADTTAFRGPVAILADGGCFSACEDFLAPFKGNHRAIIVGDTTGGSSGQPVGDGLPNGMGWGVGAKRESFPDGSPFEGVGVVPDVVVRPTADDIRRAQDPALARALEVLRVTLPTERR